MISATDYRYSLIFFALTVLFGFIGGGLTLRYHKTWLAIIAGMSMLTCLVIAVICTSLTTQKLSIEAKDTENSSEGEGDTSQGKEVYTIKIPKDREIKLKIVVE